MTGKCIVILDGPRGVGKSTMAQELVARVKSQGHSAVYFKKEIRDPADEYTNMMRHLDMFVQLAEEVVAVDRFVVTEWVLSSYHDRTPAAQLLTDCINVAERLRALKAVSVVLYATEQTLTERLETRGTRQWDMHPSSLALWRTAQLLIPGTQLWHNETEKDRAENLERLELEVARRLDREWFDKLAKEATAT